MILPEEFELNAGGDFVQLKIAKVYKEYEAQMRANNDCSTAGADAYCRKQVAIGVYHYRGPTGSGRCPRQVSGLIVQHQRQDLDLLGQCEESCSYISLTPRWAEDLCYAGPGSA